MKTWEFQGNIRPDKLSRNKIRSTPHTFHFARAIIPTQNAQLMAEAAEQFHKTGISCQTPCCYSCHRLACRERFTRQGRWLTDCWCLGQGCACFPLQEIHMNGASKGCSLDLYVVISAMPLRWNKHNIWTPTGVSQERNLNSAKRHLRLNSSHFLRFWSNA